jgi:hypothetical protein
VIAGYEQVNKSASQELESIEQESDRSTSEQDKSSTSQQAENTSSQQVDKLASQNELAETGNASDNSATEGVSKPTSQLAENPISTSQQSDNLESQQVSKPIIRKATFQVDAAILADLDRYHLQLQIEMGRRNAPYKEILVEEAIAQWLERAAKSPDRAVKSLLKRQEQR